MLLSAGLGLAGCPQGELQLDDDDTADDDDAADDDDTTPPPEEIAVTGVEWRLHDTIESLVYVTWTQTEDADEAWVEFRLEGEEWRSTPATTADTGAHEALLLGVPFDHAVTFRVANRYGGTTLTTDEVEAQTGPVPAGLPTPTLEAADPDAWVPEDRYLLGSINQYTGGWNVGSYWKFILDRQGRYVWALETPDNHWTIFMRVAQNGRDILWDEATYWSSWDGGAASQIHRMKIDGTIVETYATPGLHHAFTETADETLVWGAADGWWSETLVSLDTQGNQRTIWDCEDYHDLIDVYDQCQSNTLFWDEATDTFLYSFYTTSSVAHIDHATGETLAVFGDVDNAWDLTPANAMFHWQHGTNFTDEGTLLLSTYIDDETSDLVAREYELDAANETLIEIWHYIPEEGIRGDTAGEAHRLDNGDTLHNYGTGSRVREVTPDGTVVWDVDWTGDRLLGRTVFLDDLYDFAP